MTRWALIVAVAIVAASCRKPAGDTPTPSPGPVEAPPLQAVGPAPTHRLQLDPNVSRVTVQCGDATGGTGFFFAPSRVLTRADFVCETREPPSVKLPDGRTQLGKVLWRDDVLNAAIVEVPEGTGEPLPLGDSAATALSGLLKTGKLADDVYSELARHHFVITYPGPLPAEGSPVLDADGNVIAMVGRSLDESNVLGLPLPVIAEAGGPMAGAWQKWPQLEARARPQAEAELAAAREAMHGVLLAGAVVDSERRLFVMLARVNDSRVGPFTVSMEGCTHNLESRNLAWAPLDSSAGIDPTTRRMFSYLHRTKLDANALMSLVPIDACKVGPGTVVTIDNTRFRRATVRQVDHALEATAAQAEVPVPAPPSAPAMDNRYAAPSDAEQQWRERYARTRQHIIDVDAQVESAREFVARADARVGSRSPAFAQYALSPMEKDHYAQAKQTVERGEQLKAEARAELDELDRQAANGSVPLEWRH